MTYKIGCLSLVRRSGSRPPKEAPRHPKTPYNPPYAAKTAAKPPQNGPKTAPRRPKTAPRPPKMRPRRRTDTPRRSQEAPKGFQDPPRLPPDLDLGAFWDDIASFENCFSKELLKHTYLHLPRLCVRFLVQRSPAVLPLCGLNNI